MIKVDIDNIWIARDNGVEDDEYNIHTGDGCICLFFGKKPTREKWKDAIDHVVECEPYWKDGCYHTNKVIASKDYYYDVWKVDNNHTCFAPDEVEEKFEYLTWKDEPVKLTIDDFPEIVHICNKEMTREHFLNVWVPEIIAM